MAVLDARLPDGSGIDVCRDVRVGRPLDQGADPHVYDDDEALFAAIMAGAAGYVLKQIGAGDLVDSVRRVAAGQSLIDPHAHGAGARAGPQRTGRSPRSSPDSPSRSARSSALIAEGLTNRQIGERMFLAEKTVKNYVSSILSKLGLERRTQAAVLASKLLRG